MIIIDTPSTWTRTTASTLNPWLKQRLTHWRGWLAEAGCEIGDLGPIIIVENGDTIDAVERHALVTLSGDPGWETCIEEHGWHEFVFVTADDGSGAIILIPDRDGIDPALRAIVRTQTSAASRS